ncbi:hypothetical protein EB835_02680 [Brevibacterium sp. S22]|nr:hypothetical protein EB835_02680 [Brevibacterium sp. S22]
MVTNERLREYVQSKLSGDIVIADGEIIGLGGPALDGNSKAHRGDREWVTAWSPQQILKRLPVEFPDDPTMRITHEVIYQALCVESRGGLDGKQVWHQSRTKHMPRARTRREAWAQVTAENVLSKRPEEAEDRKIAGHWEEDLDPH